MHRQQNIKKLGRCVAVVFASEGSNSLCYPGLAEIFTFVL